MMKNGLSIALLMFLCCGLAFAESDEDNYSKEDLGLIQALKADKYNPKEIEEYAKAELDFNANEDAEIIINGGIPKRWGPAIKVTTKKIRRSNYEGGFVSKLKTIVLKTQEVVYYVFENKKELIFYVGYIKNNEKMKSIRIGDSRKEMIKKFGSGFYKYNPDLYAYQCGESPTELQFYFDAEKIERISLVFQLE